MARTSIHDDSEIEAARQLAADAKTLMQLRQSQAILIPALTGASLETTAAILGLSRDRACVLRRQFRASGGEGVDAQEQRGGRRRELMPEQDEIKFLTPWAEKAQDGGVLVVPPIHAALEQAVGHKDPSPPYTDCWRATAGARSHPTRAIPMSMLGLRNCSKKLCQVNCPSDRGQTGGLRQAGAGVVSGRGALWPHERPCPLLGTLPGTSSRRIGPGSGVPILLRGYRPPGGHAGLDGLRQHEDRGDEPISHPSVQSPSRQSRCHDSGRRKFASGVSAVHSGKRVAAAFAALLARVEPSRNSLARATGEALLQSSLRNAGRCTSRGRDWDDGNGQKLERGGPFECMGLDSIWYCYERNLE